MKKIVIMAAVAIALLATGCSKTKTCKCTITQNWVSISDMDPMVSEVTQTINSGKCTDLNSTQNSSMGGETYVQTTECIEI